MTLFDALTEVMAGLGKLRQAVADEKKANQFTPGPIDKQMVRLAATTMREIYNQMVEATGGQRRRGPRKPKIANGGLPGGPPHVGKKTA